MIDAKGVFVGFEFYGLGFDGGAREISFVPDRTIFLKTSETLNYRYTDVYI